MENVIAGFFVLLAAAEIKRLRKIVDKASRASEVNREGAWMPDDSFAISLRPAVPRHWTPRDRLSYRIVRFGSVHTHGREDRRTSGRTGEISRV
jgi:hypothetical protein